MERKEERNDLRLDRKLIYNVLIVLALGVGFGKIVGVDSAPDRAIQNYRLAQIPKTMEAKAKELREKGLDDEKFKAELERVYAATTRDALKARPTLSANDRSRWSTIRALVEPEARVYRYVPVMSELQRAERVKELERNNPNSYGASRFRYYSNEILRNCASPCPERFEKEHCVADKYKKEYVPYAIDKAWETPGWDSIDVVKHGLSDEVYDPSNPSSGYLYSSKPTLLPTIMAAPYWILNRCFGLSLVTQPFLTTRILLLFYNLIPLGIAFACLASIVDSMERSDWSRIFALCVACFASFALTFVATVNNHIPGFACVSIALWAGLKILREGKTNAIYFALAGFFGAFAVACELPALAFAGLLCVFLCVKRPLRTCAISVPLGLVVAAAFFATNYIAHQTFTPAYSHKRDHVALQEKALVENVADPNAKAELSFDPNDWYYYNYYPAGKTREAKNSRLCHWANRTGVDRGEPSIARYAFHSTIGLRGIFSLTPVWIFSVVGLGLLLKRRRNENDAFNGRGLRSFAFSGLTLLVVFLIFFLTRDQGDRSYGGMSCCPRWFFPLTPLLIPAMLPVLDKLALSRCGRAVAYAALFWSATSAFFPTWTPWTSPWLYDLAVEWNLTTPY